jgi:hypothetical protein
LLETLAVKNPSNSAFFKFFVIDHQTLEGGTSTLVTGISLDGSFTSLPDADHMGRKKKTDRDALLIHRIRTRVNDKSFQRLQSVLVKSNCQTIGQLVRQILSNEPITVFQTDITVEEPVQQLILIREELRAIGVNINQITHHFHLADSSSQKMFHALKVSEEYAKVGEKVDILINKVAEIGQRWLQRSLQVERSEV